MLAIQSYRLPVTQATLHYKPAKLKKNAKIGDILKGKGKDYIIISHPKNPEKAKAGDVVVVYPLEQIDSMWSDKPFDITGFKRKSTTRKFYTASFKNVGDKVVEKIDDNKRSSEATTYFYERTW